MIYFIIGQNYITIGRQGWCLTGSKNVVIQAYIRRVENVYKYLMNIGG